MPHVKCYCWRSLYYQSTYQIHIYTLCWRVISTNFCSILSDFIMKASKNVACNVIPTKINVWPLSITPPAISIVWIVCAFIRHAIRPIAAKLQGRYHYCLSIFHFTWLKHLQRSLRPDSIYLKTLRFRELSKPWDFDCLNPIALLQCGAVQFQDGQTILNVNLEASRNFAIRIPTAPRLKRLEVVIASASSYLCVCAYIGTSPIGIRLI